MNGLIAQLVALVCHANAYLKNGAIIPFFLSNSTCKICDKINFVILKRSLFGKTKEVEVASTPDDWFKYLKNKSAMAIKLLHFSQSNFQISERMSAGFVGGGGNWGIEVLLSNGKSEFWLARWEVWNQNAPDQKKWRVTYGMVSTGKTLDDKNAITLDNAMTDLYKSLNEIHSFSEKNDCGSFTECFEKALDTLRSGNKQGYHQDMSPNNLLLEEAELMLDTCQSAWVFGGMGSWNDMGFDGIEQLEYQRVSDQLFNSINNAIVAATNSCA